MRISFPNLVVLKCRSILFETKSYENKISKSSINLQVVKVFKFSRYGKFDTIHETVTGVVYMTYCHICFKFF